MCFCSVCVRVSKSILVFNKITQTLCAHPSSALLDLDNLDTLVEKVSSQPVTANRPHPISPCCRQPLVETTMRTARCLRRSAISHCSG